MKSVQTLVGEHDNILRMLDVIHYACLEILGGAPVEVSDFKMMVDFIRKYADKTHHGKEEDYLFQAMVNELGTMGENLIRHGMLVEHDIARLYVSDLDTALDCCMDEQTQEARLAVVVAAGSYEQLLRRHIQKENDAVFPFGEKNLSEQSAQWVEQQIQAFDSDKDNAAQRDRQLNALDALERKYPKPMK